MDSREIQALADALARSIRAADAINNGRVTRDPASTETIYYTPIGGGPERVIRGRTAPQAS